MFSSNIYKCCVQIAHLKYISCDAISCKSPRCSMSHLPFCDSEEISLRLQHTLDVPFCLTRTITCHFMHHYVTKVCGISDWAVFCCASILFAAQCGICRISSCPLFPRNQKMNGVSKYSLCPLQLLWTVYCKDPQLISELLTSLLQNGPS